MTTTGTASSSIGIGLLLPNVLGTYSDRGNATVLAQRLRWRGIPAEVVEATVDRKPPTTCDIYLLGGGEDAAESFATQWISRHPGLLAALGSAQVLAVCAGLQMLGQWLPTSDRGRTPGLGLLDLTTTRGPRRAVGKAVVDADAPGVGLLTGFENHQGITHLGPDVPRLGQVLHGTGNGDGTDGVLTPTIIGTYLHGPVLARNPALADLLLTRATGLDRLPPLQVPDEDAARRAHLALSRANPRRRRARWPGRSQSTRALGGLAE